MKLQRGFGQRRNPGDIIVVSNDNYDNFEADDNGQEKVECDLLQTYEADPWNKFENWF